MKKSIILLGILCGLNATAQNWSLTGNTGTSPGTNFLGTTDIQDLIFKINNSEKIRLTNTGRLVFFNSNSTPSYLNNIYIGGGNESPANSTSNWGNVSIGLGSMNLNTTGTANTAIGFNSLSKSTIAFGNTALGINSMMENNSGNNNVAVGVNSISALVSGNRNTAIGVAALNGSAGFIGNDNTALGTDAARSISSGSFNTIIGANSFRSFNSGLNNVVLGYNNFTTNVLTNTSNNIIIGSNLNSTKTQMTNELNIGNWILGNNGTIGIGQFSGTLPSDGIAADGKKYKLFVKDGIKTEKVKVDIAADNGWADYVFARDYNLMTLKDVELFINTNGHLPEVPSEEEAIKNGIELKEMNILLLKKVEELTLHIIDQNKQIESQKVALENQNKRLEKLEKNQNN